MSEENYSREQNYTRAQNYPAEDTIDLADLIRIYIKKWLFLGLISMAVGVVILFGLKFFYNNNVRKWTVNFEFEFPGIENNLYPDGTSFKYQDFVSRDVIEKAIASDTNKFGSYTVDEVAKNISVKMNYEEDKDKQKVFNGIYTYELKQSYFKSDERAGEFAEALLQALADEISVQADRVYYHAYLDSFDDADTFQTMLDYLVKQKEYVDTKYDTWIEAYGEQYAVEGVTLSKYKQNALMALSDKEYNALDYELKTCQYVYSKAEDEEKVSKYQIQILNEEYEDNAKKISGLTEALENLRKDDNSTGDITGKPNETYYYETIAAYTERQVDIEREIEKINTKISNMGASKEVAAYYAKISAVRKKLDKQATILETKIAPAIYNEKTIYNIGKMDSVGGFSSVLGAILGFVFTYFVVGFLVFIMEGDKKKA